MALRGKKPEEKIQRLKLLLFSPAGVGKTTAAIQMPRPYIIDTEDGTAHYGKIIEDKGGAVFKTSSFDEAIEEVRALSSEKHEYRTLVIDSFTILYDAEVDIGEEKKGDEWGKHTAYAGKAAKRLWNLLAQLDMNVVVTAHAKTEYERKGKTQTAVGNTFDGWKKLDYYFDLVLELERVKADSTRVATVRKTRFPEFPDQERFEWSYDELVRRYGRDRLERRAESVELPNEELVAAFTAAYRQLSEAEIKRLGIDKAVKSIEDVADMPRGRVEKGLELIKAYLNKNAA